MALPLLRRRATRPPLSRARLRLAWAIALGADLAQLALPPVFGPGFVSLIDDGLDVAVAIALTVLLGWHWEFLPAFAVEMVPFVDLVPTWSLACWLATRGRGRPGIAPDAPAPPGPRSPA